MLNEYNSKSVMCHLKRLLAAALLFAPLSAAHAALIDVSSLSVNNVSANVLAVDITTNTTLIDTGAMTSLVPPAEIIMGSYQSSIFEFSTNFTGGIFMGTVYSDPLLSAPAATVDTTVGDFSSIDLSSLKLQGTINYDSGAEFNFDTALWPITTTPTSSFYDPLNGDFSLSWAFNEIIDFNTVLLPQSLDTTIDFSISGTATVVPVPAALLLFLSGLLGLTGFIYKKK